MEQIPFYHIGPTSVGDNAFHHEYKEHGINPFKAANLDWCGRCKMVVDCDTHSVHQSDIYLFKKTCNRCGKVTAWGCYSVPLINSGKPLPPSVHSWIVEGGEVKKRSVGVIGG